MRIAIFGTGGVGGYFGGRLAQAGQDVVFIARGKHLEAMRTHGLRVDSINGDFTVRPVEATDDPATVGIVDVILVGVKAWQVPEAAEAMRPMVGSETFVVPLQNGVEAPSQLAAVLGRDHVLGGLCGLMTFIVEPGHIRHAATEPFVRFGELDNRPSERAEKLRQAFAKAKGLTVEIPPDIQVALWHKFVFVTVWSGLGAVTRAPIGVFRSQPGTRQMLEQAVREVFDVGQAHNIALPQDTITRTVEFLDSLAPYGTASMQRDIMAGRPSELDSQNGAVVRLGQQAGVETPVNAFIYYSLLPMEMRARGQLPWPEAQKT
ncbi:MAG: 2-dehydropantoate 2-reductase [Planctomycetota bacterium]|jgi:2-dehydropantoate 2-reductase